MVAEEANLWLVVGQENLLGLRSKWPRARHVKPCVESFGSKFLVVPSAAEENTVAKPLKPVEEDSSKKSDKSQKWERQDACEDGWQSKGDQGSGETDDPVANDDGNGVTRHD